MKCLSVSQPFADLIAKGKKTIELRSWNTSFRGEFLIHAPIKIRKKDCKRLKIKTNLPTGAIIGKAKIYDVKKYSSRDEVKNDADKHFASKNFYNRRYGFCLKNAKEFLVPIPYKGKLGFFDVNLKPTIKKNQIKTDLIEEEYRYQWVGHH
ncbi:MAG: ASCH domain-containing protein [Nitrososphaerota archaeon]